MQSVFASRRRRFFVAQCVSVTTFVCIAAIVSNQGNAERQRWNEERERDCNVWLTHRISPILDQLEKDRYHPRIAAAWRSGRDQAVAAAAGTSTLLVSFHNIEDSHGRPSSFAVDVTDDRTSSLQFKLELAKLAEMQGLQTGISWGLVASERQRVHDEIKSGVEKSVRIGWDPYHIQPLFLKIGEATILAQTRGQ